MQPRLEFIMFGLGSKFLSTRASARTARRKLEDQLVSASGDVCLVIDFTGIEAMTISFADEFIGRFYTSLEGGDAQVSAVELRGLNDETVETIDICLERRELIAAAVHDGQALLLGRSEILANTYFRALDLGSFSAVDLADALAITPQNANNRLKRLVAAGAVRRRRTVAERGGKEFRYTVTPHLSDLAPAAP